MEYLGRNATNYFMYIKENPISSLTTPLKAPAHARMMSAISFLVQLSGDSALSMSFNADSPSPSKYVFSASSISGVIITP